MKRAANPSFVLMIIGVMMGVVAMACQYECDFCGSYWLESDHSQLISFQRDGEYQWMTDLAQASGNWYAVDEKIAVTVNWGTFTGRIEGKEFIDSTGSVWAQTTEDRSCLICCNVPRPAVKITPTPTPPQASPPINSFNLGDVATYFSLRIAVINAEKTEHYKLEAAMNAPPNTYLVIVNVQVLNLGNSSIGTEANLFSIRDQAGSIYRPIKPTVLASSQFPWYALAVGPGEAISGRIFYIVPNLSSGLSIVTSVNGQYLAWVLPW